MYEYSNWLSRGDKMADEANQENSENIMLGGNIELVGFKEMDGGSMIILKKMIGNHVRKLSDVSKNFEKLTVHMKKVGGGDNKFEINIKMLDNGTAYTTEVTDFNLFITLNKAMEKIQSQIVK